MLVDGGIRRGGDIAKALAMGAKAVLSAAPTPTGWPAPASRAWPARSTILRADLERTLALLGCASTASLDGSYVEVPKHW